jgi:GLPGLI family protein
MYIFTLMENMKNSVRRILITVFLIFICLTLKAQIQEGKVSYSITFPGAKLSQDEQAMMPTESTVWFKNEVSRMEMKMGMGMNMVTISDKEGVLLLMDMMGNKMAIRKTPADLKKQKKSETDGQSFTATGETKEIAGYTCKKAVLKNEDKGDMTIWFTEAILANNQWNESMNGVTGFPMEFNMKSDRVDMHMVASKVSAEKVDGSMFKVPSDYKMMTEDEMKSMFGGMK